MYGKTAITEANLKRDRTTNSGANLPIFFLVPFTIAFGSMLSVAFRPIGLRQHTEHDVRRAKHLERIHSSAVLPPRLLIPATTLVFKHTARNKCTLVSRHVNNDDFSSARERWIAVTRSGQEFGKILDRTSRALIARCDSLTN